MKNNPTPRRRHQLGAEVMPQYDFIVCGSGSSGCVVARRLSEDADVSVLLLEAGGPDDMPAVMEADQWLLNLGSERDWNFSSQPSPHVNGRSIPMSMGKVLGGGSSINGMMWSRGHQNDWDYIASFSRPGLPRDGRTGLHRARTQSQPDRTRSDPGCPLGGDPDV
jgi:choline dehydrogenase